MHWFAKRGFGRTGAAMLPAAAILLAWLGSPGCSSNDGGGGPAAPQHELIEFTLVAGHPEVLDTWPGPDGFIGTADDSVQAAASALGGSESNLTGVYSYNAFDFGSGATETGLLPAGMNAATFIQGSVTVDHDVLDAGGGPIITAWNVSGTQPYAGHGAYTAVITAVNGGTYDHATHAMTLNVNLTATLPAGTATASSLELTGTAYIIHAADFGDATGNAYLDDVLIPLAQGAGAGSLFFAEASGTVPASSGGSGGTFPAMPLHAVMVGLAAGD